MSGITAVSATETLDAASTSVDHSVSGFVTKEQISLGLTGSPVKARWTISKPSNSSGACELDSKSQLSARFTPDVDGLYTVSCIIDDVTLYVLRIAAVSLANISTISVLHLLPCADEQVPVPTSGVMLYFSSTSGLLSKKKPDGTTESV